MTDTETNLRHVSTACKNAATMIDWYIPVYLGAVHLNTLGAYDHNVCICELVVHLSQFLIKIPAMPWKELLEWCCL